MWSIVSEKLVDCIVNVPRLIQGNEYIFRVRGVNKYGIGDALESEPIIAKNAFGMQTVSPSFVSTAYFYKHRNIGEIGNKTL